MEEQTYVKFAKEIDNLYNKYISNEQLYNERADELESMISSQISEDYLITQVLVLIRQKNLK